MTEKNIFPNSFNRRKFISLATKTAGLAMTAPLFAGTKDEKVGEAFVSERRELTDPSTGRRLIQLTSGDCFDMPMYFFGPTFAKDNKTIVFYRYNHNSGEIQLYKIHSDTGVTVRLTNAKTENSLWRPYMQKPGFGVRDLMSAVNQVTNEVIYFDTNEIRAVQIESLADRLIARVPEGRVPSGLTGVSPNGKLFCYPHFERKWWEAQLPPKTSPPERWEPRKSKLVVVDTASGESTDILMVNFWITHSDFYDNNRLLFCHDATDTAMQMTDLRYPLQYENLRTHTEDGYIVHYQATERGIMYELQSEKKGGLLMAGFYNPDTRERREYKLDSPCNRQHIGRDPEGRLLFFETGVPGGLGIVCYPELIRGKINPGVQLTGTSFETFGVNQRAHYHPMITPDRKYIIFTGGDSRNRTNHLFLVDISDLKDTVIR